MSAYSKSWEITKLWALKAHASKGTGMIISGEEPGEFNLNQNV